MTDILVVGSVNMDYIIQVDQPPGPGETVLASSLLKQPGGKGANQAVAAARMGAQVQLVASLGDDEDGAEILHSLRAEGVESSTVELIAHKSTGLAMVSLWASGENSITVVSGANRAVDQSRVRRIIGQTSPGSRIVILQGELRQDVTSAAARAATEAGDRVILNLAPYSPLPLDVTKKADPLVLNEAEASSMLGRNVHSPQAALAAVDDLLRVAASVVITLGSGGAVWATEGEKGHVPIAKKSPVVDTTGAGDAFVGALAAELADGASLEEATKTGVLAGTFSVGRFGAQQSYPSRAQLIETATHPRETVIPTH